MVLDGGVLSAATSCVFSNCIVCDVAICTVFNASPQLYHMLIGYTLLHNAGIPEKLHEVIKINHLTTYTMLH